MADTLVTTLSTKGQVILPKAIRDRRDWNAGTKLIVEETPEGVLLKRAPAFAPTAQGSAFRMRKYDGPPKTIEEMDAAALESVAHEFLRGIARDE